MTEKKKQIIHKRNILPIALFIVFLCTFIFSLYSIIKWRKDSLNTQKQIEEITEIAEVTEVEDNENTEIIDETIDKDNDYWNFISVPLLSVNFNELKQRNSDTVAWLKVNGTNINYPVVQTTNNEYYLNHSFDKSINNAGWLFLDLRNNITQLEKNNIIYGHNRVDHTMFGTLQWTLKESWTNNKNNYTINLSTETYNSLWQVFSVYEIDVESYYIATEFTNDNTYQTFLDTLKQRSTHDFGVTLSPTDKILTLSTCNGDNKRVVLHAKLIKIENK